MNMLMISTFYQVYKINNIFIGKPYYGFLVKDIIVALAQLGDFLFQITLYPLISLYSTLKIKYFCPHLLKCTKKCFNIMLQK